MATLPARPTIALLGAPGSGAKTLARALREHLSEHAAQVLCAIDLAAALPGNPPPEDGSPAMASALALALAQRPSAPALVLLMGLDLPVPAGHRAAQEAFDAVLRQGLATAGLPYRVVYGQGTQRTAKALDAIEKIATNPYASKAFGPFDQTSGAETVRSARLRAWNCEKCSDPECEHRLFTALAGRDIPAR